MLQLALAYSLFPILPVIVSYVCLYRYVWTFY